MMMMMMMEKTPEHSSFLRFQVSYNMGYVYTLYGHLWYIEFGRSHNFASGGHTKVGHAHGTLRQEIRDDVKANSLKKKVYSGIN